ncbi:MAG: GNAT family N-acetyltransferase [Oscillospiraceae bacterium]|nr:GNAT family N-acetyltransferase [Oscillospiraceae bacterium]
MKTKSFKSERLIFREICIEDTEYIVKWRSTPEIYEYFRIPEPLATEHHIEWFNTIYLNDETRVEYIIIHPESMTPIGLVGVSNIQENSLQIGYLIGELSFQKQGYASESINTVIEEYKKTGLWCFFAEIHSANIASIKTIEKCGFRFDIEQENDFLLYKKVCK